MNDYPALTPDREVDRNELLRIMVRERTNDISEFNNLNNRFMAGRKTGKIPSGASDVAVTDRIGDFNYNFSTGYYYLLVDNAGTAVWARIPLDTSW